jgi:hypothetical protein
VRRHCYGDPPRAFVVGGVGGEGAGEKRLGECCKETGFSLEVSVGRVQDEFVLML